MDTFGEVEAHVAQGQCLHGLVLQYGTFQTSKLCSACMMHKVEEGNCSCTLKAMHTTHALCALLTCINAATEWHDTFHVSKAWAWHHPTQYQAQYVANLQHMLFNGQ